MIELAAPAFLLAGALGALVPVALHLIRRRPRSQAALPTQRFLSPDPRARLRVGRPTDLLLLALRILLPLLAGAALARPVWHPSGRGVGEVVMLDRAAAPPEAWRFAVSEARRRVLRADGTAAGALVLFDTTAEVVDRRRVNPALFDSLAAAPPTARESRYAAALSALPAAVRGLRGADSVRVTLVTRPTWRGWSDGLGPLRRTLWPGALTLVALPDAPPASAERTASSEDAPRRVVYLTASPDSLAAYPVAAMQALGWTVTRAASSADVDALTAPPARPNLPPRTTAIAAEPDSIDRATTILAAAPVTTEAAEAIARRAQQGATVLVTAPAAPLLARLLPETRTSAGARTGGGAGGTIWFASGERISGADAISTAPSATGAAVLATWDDGSAAAVARGAGRGCVVFLSADVERGEMRLDPAYPRLFQRLADGCGAGGADAAPDAPLDAGARALLRGSGAPVLAASRVAGTGGGVPLGRRLMAAALAVALVETFFAYARRKPA